MIITNNEIQQVWTSILEECVKIDEWLASGFMAVEARIAHFMLRLESNGFLLFISALCLFLRADDLQLIDQMHFIFSGGLNLRISCMWFISEIHIWMFAWYNSVYNLVNLIIRWAISQIECIIFVCGFFYLCSNFRDESFHR